MSDAGGVQASSTGEGHTVSEKEGKGWPLGAYAAQFLRAVCRGRLLPTPWLDRVRFKLMHHLDAHDATQSPPLRLKLMLDACISPLQHRQRTSTEIITKKFAMALSLPHSGTCPMLACFYSIARTTQSQKGCKPCPFELDCYCPQ